MSKPSHRSFANRVYDGCSERDLQRAGFVDGSYEDIRLGKLCYSYCKKRKLFSSDCKELETVVLDLNDKNQYDKFYVTEMSCISMLDDNL